MDYEVLAHKDMYHGAIIDVAQDTLRMPDGRAAVREVVYHINAAAVVPIDAQGQIIMVRQYRHPAGEIVWEIPAGTLDSKSEDPRDCAERELQEETGFQADELIFLTKFYTSIGFCTEVIYVYAARGLKPGVQKLDEDEFVTVEAITMARAMEMIFSGEIMDAKTITGILACKEKIFQA